MLGLLVKWAVVSAVFMVAAAATPSIRVRNWGAAFGAAAVFGVTNVLLGWLARFLLKVILFLPAVLTLGLAYLIVPVLVNMLLLKIADSALGDGLEIRGAAPLFALAAALSVTSALLFH
jgi:uncharacterized membrane protein YvlD (DUF360 family)